MSNYRQSADACGRILSRQEPRTSGACLTSIETPFGPPVQRRLTFSTQACAAELELLGLAHVIVHSRSVSGFWNFRIVIKRGRSASYALARMRRWVMKRYLRELRRYLL